jgi:hypothetical protein
MADKTPAYDWPWPLNDVDGMSSPPTEVDLADVFAPLLEQCESLATSLLVGLVHSDYEAEKPQAFAPSARVLRDYLRLARQIFLTWEQRPDGVSAQAGQMGMALLVAMTRRRTRKEDPQA